MMNGMFGINHVIGLYSLWLYGIPSGLLYDDGHTVGLRPPLSNNIPSGFS
jgi:hypothetical protein